MDSSIDLDKAGPQQISIPGFAFRDVCLSRQPFFVGLNLRLCFIFWLGFLGKSKNCNLVLGLALAGSVCSVGVMAVVAHTLMVDVVVVVAAMAFCCFCCSLLGWFLFSFSSNNQKILRKTPQTPRTSYKHNATYQH